MRLEQSERLLIEELYKDSLIRIKKSGVTTATTIQKLTGDASTRRYYRVLQEPETYIACLDEPQKNSSDEYPFLSVHEILSLNGVGVPKLYDTDLKKGFLLEEDLGDITLLRHLSKQHTEGEEYLSYMGAMNELLKIHSIKTSADPDGKCYQRLAFDSAKLMSEIDFTIKYFLKKLLRWEPVPEEDLLRSEFGKLCNSISSLPMVLTHRDYHSRNLMIHRGDVRVIDFQDARMGASVYDLASLLDDCYYQLRHTNQYRLLKYYYENTASKNHWSFDQFVYYYDAMAVQRLFKAIGSFSFIYAQREDIRYLKYIGYAFEKIRMYLQKHNKELGRLGDVLLKLYYEK